MKLLTWNIRQGGSKRRLPFIVEGLCKHSPDVMVLTEFRVGEKGEYIKSKLRENGYEHQFVAPVPANTNAVLIASSHHFEVLPSQTQIHGSMARWTEIRLPVFNLYLLGVHIPVGSISSHNKVEFWNAVIKYAQKYRDQRAIILGDLNTGLADDFEGAPFLCQNEMQQVLDNGWIDSWRNTHGGFRQYSWYSNKGNGFRIDHIFLSSILKPFLMESYFSHEERLQRVSDHSVLITELNI